VISSEFLAFLKERNLSRHLFRISKLSFKYQFLSLERETVLSRDRYVSPIILHDYTVGGSNHC
jgi:hypothetical protein